MMKKFFILISALLLPLAVQPANAQTHEVKFRLNIPECAVPKSNYELDTLKSQKPSNNIRNNSLNTVNYSDSLKNIRNN